MSRLSASTVVLRYYLYRATARPGFHYPVYTLFLLFNDLTLAQIGLIASIQSVVVVTSEVPTGYIGDRIGRRNSLAVGAAIMLVSNASYLVATDFIGFTFTFVTLSFGGTFVSGSGSAWLYDTLQEHDMEEEFTRISGRGRALGQWLRAVTLVVGGFLYAVNRYYPFYAGVVAAAISLVLVLRLPQNRAYDDEATGDDLDDDRMTIVDALPVIREQLSMPDLRWFVVYLALFSGAVLTMDMWIQPIAQDTLETTFGPTLDGWGIPEGGVLGILYAAFTVVSAVTSDYASDVEELLGVRKAMLLIPVAIAASYVLAGLVPLLVFPMFFVMKGGNSLVGPITNRYINDQVESVGRATLLSSVAMLRNVAGVPFRVGSGILATWYTSMTAVAILGAIFLVLAFVLWSVASPVSADYEPPDSGNTTADAAED
ncbi:major facilitator superfamily transport protein [Halobacterium hubeiense]|uniref:Major facilitator superfamily transport protein n=1 Tax=Halobacterium hubeiense TaxID=1407499 RepID=A0A0U5H8W8_9EURY|nr:MFS transporter [Halobacterium hubeiense]CQH60284.1 major facilitator superfamily transport protein [Halobacterium hubeiense]